MHNPISPLMKIIERPSDRKAYVLLENFLKDHNRTQEAEAVAHLIKTKFDDNKPNTSEK